MKLRTTLCTICFAMTASSTLSAAKPVDISLLPQPASLKTGKGSHRIESNISFSCDKSLQPYVDFYASLLRGSTGWTVPVQKKGTVHFTQVSNLGKEAYELEVTSTQIEIRASHATGFFYGFQTLRQLMPAEVFQLQGEVTKTWNIPCVSIKDQPRFEWRGIMIDVARTFQTKETMLELIDSMALNKLNTLH